MELPRSSAPHFFQGIAGKLLAYSVELNDASFAIENHDQQVGSRVQDGRNQDLFLLQRLLVAASADEYP